MTSPEYDNSALAVMYDPSISVEWVAEVFQDWTTLQIPTNGMVFAFNRLSGEVYKIPHPDVPFLQIAKPYKVVRDGDKVRFE